MSNNSLIIFLGEQDIIIQGTVDRTAGHNGAVRIYGGRILRNWFADHSNNNCRIAALIIDAQHIFLKVDSAIRR
jgi:hypothetical protein